MARLIVASFIAASFAACTGTRPLDHHQPCPCAPHWTCDTSQNVCVEDVPGGGDGAVSGQGGVGADAGGGMSITFSATQVEAALANCSLPHGPAATASTADEEKRKLIGAWMVCPPESAQPQTMFAPGIWFASDGTFANLVMDGGTIDGGSGLKASVGLLSQGKWSTSCYDTDPSLVPNAQSKPCPGTSFYGVNVQLHTTGGGDDPTNCFVGPITFESSPTRAYVVDWPQLFCSAQFTGNSFDFWMVPLQ